MIARAVRLEADPAHYHPRFHLPLSPFCFVTALALLIASLAAPAAATTGDHLERLTPVATVFTDRTDFIEMVGSAADDVTGPLWAVDLVVPSPGGSTSGCDTGDFVDFPAGSIALIQRGTCLFRIKAENAVAAGALGVLIFNEGNDPSRTGPVFGTLGDFVAPVPVVATSFGVGDDLRAGVLHGDTGATVRIATNGDGPTPAPPDEQVDALVAIVEGMGLAKGAESSLTSKLEATGAAVDRGHTEAACGSLRAFENQVRAQAGKQLTDGQASVLLLQAAQLRTALGC